MKQYEIEVHDSMDVVVALQDIKKYCNDYPYSALLIHVYSGYSDAEKVRRVTDSIRQELPDAIIAGLTAGGEIAKGTMSAQSMMVVVSVFHLTQIQLKTYTFSAGQEAEMGRKIREEIDATPSVKAAEILADCWKISSAALFKEINACDPKVQIFGAVPYAHETEDPKFVFTGDTEGDITVALITYAGESFHISTDHVIGWKPIGTGMQVTKAEGKVLHEIDHRPAIDVYEKYLKITNDDQFFGNVFEFPLLRYIHDTYILRMPFACSGDGSIQLGAMVEEGDTIFLSYGDISTILSEVHEARSRMERFHPHYIYLYNCATRKSFWKNGINNEIQPFQRVASTTGLFTGGEILRVNGELIHFNAALLVIGMREGDPDQRELLQADKMERSDAANAGQATMIRRMAYFINVAMQELSDLKSQK